MTDAYNKVFNKFIKNGIDSLTPEETAELNSGKSDYGYRFPVVYDEYMPDIESGEVPVILADMKNSYILDIQDDVYLSRTSATTNSLGETVDGIRLSATFTLGGRGQMVTDIAV